MHFLENALSVFLFLRPTSFYIYDEKNVTASVVLNNNKYLITLFTLEGGAIKYSCIAWSEKSLKNTLVLQGNPNKPFLLMRQYYH